MLLSNVAVVAVGVGVDVADVVGAVDGADAADDVAGDGAFCCCWW